jgi:hypothetical protein
MTKFAQIGEQCYYERTWKEDYVTVDWISHSSYKTLPSKNKIRKVYVIPVEESREFQCSKCLYSEYAKLIFSSLSSKFV